MNKTITMTTKGTFTLPALLRKQLGVNTKGDKLNAVYDEANQRVIISKPVDFAQIQKRLEPYTKNVKPLKDVSTYYQTRKPRI